MSKHIIYYFSGTGNSRYAAEKIAKSLHDTTMYNMRCNPEGVSMQDVETIGFVFPIYHWTMPVYVQEYIKKLLIKSNAYIYAVATCGMVVMNAFIDLENLLKAKGAHLSYAAKLPSVAGYVASYEPMFHNDNRKQKEEKRLQEIISDILVKKSSKIPKKSIGKEIARKIVLPSAKALPTKDTGFVIGDSCIGCGSCVKLCPAGNIVIQNGRLEFQHHCTQCMSCVVYCPKAAIDYKNKTQNRTKYHHDNVDLAKMIQDTEYIQ